VVAPGTFSRSVPPLGQRRSRPIVLCAMVRTRVVECGSCKLEFGAHRAL
jgi:hypothetical protein